MLNLPNLLTAFNLICGIMAILAAVTGRIDLVPLFIVVAAVLDFLDGFIARKLGISGELGKQLDSLADVVTFGVAPGVFMMVLISSFSMDSEELTSDLIAYNFRTEIWALFAGEVKSFSVLLPLLIPFFSLFRLAKFTIDDTQKDKFIGVPTPANTLFFLSFCLSVSFPQWTPEFIQPISAMMFAPWVVYPLIVVMSLSLVAPIPLFALKFKQFGWSDNRLRYVFLLISLAIIVIFRTWSFAIIVFLYLILSLFQNFINNKSEHEIQS